MFVTKSKMQKIIRHELVEITIPAGSTATKYLIPDLPNLRNVHIFGLQVYTKSDTTTGIQTQLPLTDVQPTLRTAFFTLVNYGGKEFLKQAPAHIFHSSFNQNIGGGDPVLNQFEWNSKNFVGQRVNYPKSYIEFSTPPAIAGVSQCFMFSVYYSLPIADEKKESGYSFGKRA